LDADGLTACCATAAEERVAKRAGLRTALIGLGGVNGVPGDALVSYGLAGALDGLVTGTVVDAVKVVDESGATLWEGAGLGVPGAVKGTILASDRVIDAAEERARLHAATGADAVDLESGVLARSGRLVGCVRAISDTPARPLGAIVGAVTPQGALDWPGIARGLARSPRGFLRAGLDWKRALDSLGRTTARALS
jgi:adenosylhomocysteine nucleosidase